MSGHRRAPSTTATCGSGSDPEDSIVNVEVIHGLGGHTVLSQSFTSDITTGHLQKHVKDKIQKLCSFCLLDNVDQIWTDPYCRILQTAAVRSIREEHRAVVFLAVSLEASDCESGNVPKTLPAGR